MGGNGPSRFPAEDEGGGGVTFVKGIRLSDRVINRMKNSTKTTSHFSADPTTQVAVPVPASSGEPSLPLQAPVSPQLISTPPIPPTSPSVEAAAPPVKLIPPPPVTFHSLPPPSLEPETPPAPSSRAENPEVPQTLTEPPEPKEPDTQTTPQTEQEKEPTPSEPAAAEPLESAATLVQPVLSPSPLASAQPGAPPESSSDEASASCRHEELPVALAPPHLEAPPPTEPPATTLLPPAAEDEEPSLLPPPAEVMEEELREKIRAEMEESLEEEISQKRRELQQQLEEIQVLRRAEATTAARAEAEEQVKKTLEAERAMRIEKLTESVEREKAMAEHEKLMAQLHWMELKARQLEEREKEMKKRNELYKEHVSKLEAKCAEFYKVSVENFQKGKEETLKRFACFNIQPLCRDLQDQILKCYMENPGRTLTCSGIASAYMQCVDNAKKDKLTTGG
ncbi:PREDICTED: MICOS complex subunit Mic25-like isoform X1 [Poecilia mexicana]|uniref:Coiled-coil-helix-coiled-coil-helix domain containing 3b n=1 Tax=Poecilia mexicana TaxID=48701 RepID=A0A3B3WS00_9TELE|nr:PREDICTED: MICOS complex subunit Mic25-like isoform X1 [Poecilia mexicana]